MTKEVVGSFAFGKRGKVEEEKNVLLYNNLIYSYSSK